MNLRHMHSKNSSPTLSNLSFYASDIHECSYLDDRQAVSIFADPTARMSVRLYSQLINYGFRRSGEYIYAPQCPGCDACVPLRVLAADFQPRRIQKRTLNRNKNLVVNKTPAQFNPEHFSLYQRYIQNRHANSSMANPTKADYVGFLTSSWSETYFYEIRDNQSLLAVMVADKIYQGLSAVYTFYDPGQEVRSLGHFAILQLIKSAQELGLPYVYLGYWIAHCNKMKYKSNYQPAEIFRNGKWFNFHQKVPIGS